MAQVIQPEDFNKNTADPLRGRWTVDQMAAVCEALAGKFVFVETDNMTGHSWYIRLERVSYYHQTGSVLGYTKESPQGCWYPLASVGVIMDPRPGARGKWDALDIHRKAQAAKREAQRAKA
ncbi:hypothetical protein CPT_Sycamore_045 [Streptomyces phage Sycamore]|uniref:Uncharacterized protein n=1 Tax=Streptomyces phage Sycamore TaxID=2767589 RepID=A0A873WNE3_9CAUD|nr:hypothetical protein CPT_Sycamore_045 [Streptomyces phage Sycamore]